MSSSVVLSRRSSALRGPVWAPSAFGGRFSSLVVLSRRSCALGAAVWTSSASEARMSISDVPRPPLKGACAAEWTLSAAGGLCSLSDRLLPPPTRAFAPPWTSTGGGGQLAHANALQRRLMAVPAGGTDADRDRRPFAFRNGRRNASWAQLQKKMGVNGGRRPVFISNWASFRGSSRSLKKNDRGPRLEAVSLEKRGVDRGPEPSSCENGLLPAFGPHLFLETVPSAPLRAKKGPHGGRSVGPKGIGEDHVLQPRVALRDRRERTTRAPPVKSPRSRTSADGG